MDMSATAKQLSALRTCLADIARSGGNPNHAADGKFASGSGKSVPDIRVEPGETGGKYARLIARAEDHESIHVQCTHCSRMKNGPLSGRILGVVVRKDGWSHGICAPCEHAWLQQYFQSKGMSQEMAERRIALFMTNQPIPDDLLLPGETPSAEQRAQRLRVLAAHVTQVAEQVRRAGHPLRDGRGRWIGWVGGDGTVHMNGEGHAHTGWGGVTHHSAKAGKSGGGTKTTGNRELDAEIARQQARITEAKRQLTTEDAKHDASVWNYYQQEISDAEYRISVAQQKAGIAQPAPVYKTAMTDEQFWQAFARTHQQMQAKNLSGLVEIRDMQRHFKREYGMSTSEFSARMNAMREDGDQGEHPGRLHFEDDGESGRAPHFYHGLAFHYVALTDLSKGTPNAYRGDPYEKTGGVRTGALMKAFDYAAKGSGGKSGGTKALGEATSNAADHPFAAEYRARLAALRTDAEKSGYFAAHPEAEKAHASAEKAARGGKGGKAKTAGAEKVWADDGLVPIRRVEGREIGIVAPPDARFLRELYGHDQLAKALARYTPAKIREAADGVGVSRRGSKADIIARILDKLKDEPETTYSQLKETPLDRIDTQRAALPPHIDLAALSHQVNSVIADLRRIA